MDNLFSPGQVEDDEQAWPRAQPAAQGLADLSTVLLSRGSFDSQAHCHMSVAHGALVAKGHAFIVQGSASTSGV